MRATRATRVTDATPSPVSPPPSPSPLLWLADPVRHTALTVNSAAPHFAIVPGNLVYLFNPKTRSEYPYNLRCGPLGFHAMAMATTLASPSSLSSLCTISGRTTTPARGAFSLKRIGAGRGVCVRAQRAGGDPESKQLLDAFFLGKALADTVSERIGSLVGELLSEVGQRQAEQQRHIREFQNEVQERARTSAMRAAQKALATEPPVTRAAATQVSTVTYDEEPNGATVTESTTSATEGANGLPSLPYEDLPPLDTSSEQGAPDY